MSKACECNNCDETSGFGDFAPGHDQKLRTALEAKVGGILKHRDIINAVLAHVRGETTAEQLGTTVRSIVPLQKGARP